MAAVIEFPPNRLQRAEWRYRAVLRMPVVNEDNQLAFRIAAAELALAEREAMEKAEQLTYQPTN